MTMHLIGDGQCYEVFGKERLETQPGKRGIPTHGNPTEGPARRPTGRPEQVDRIQDISRKTNVGIRRSAEDVDEFQDFS